MPRDLYLMSKTHGIYRNSCLISDFVFDRGGVLKSKSIFNRHLQLTGTKKYLVFCTPDPFVFGSCKEVDSPDYLRNCQ
jgi:hypothetical protein